MASCSRAPQWRVAEGAVWNTTYRIVYHSAVNLDDSIQKVLNDVEGSLSPFNPQSLISKINRNETDCTNAMIDSVFAISQYVNARTAGRFDPTVSPLVNLWGFGYDKNARKRIEADTIANASGNMPFALPQEQIDSALAMVGIGQCHVKNGHIAKKHHATTFNFSAVTKGFACDCVALMLQRNGSANNLVEIGGEIAATGHNREGKRWRIQIDAPIESAEAVHTPLTAISITPGGVATSGNYRNFHNTKQYGRIGHTIDPLSGYPAKTDVVAATVTAPNAAIADAWATACMASNAHDAIESIENEPQVECLLVIAHGDTLECITSTGFPTPTHLK